MEQLGALTQSPFAIPREGVEALDASEGFRMLRRYLAHDAEYVCIIQLSHFSVVAFPECLGNLQPRDARAGEHR